MKIEDKILRIKNNFFLDKKDIMFLLGISEKKAREEMNKVNEQLKKEGCTVFVRGKVVKDEFFKRAAISNGSIQRQH